MNGYLSLPMLIVGTVFLSACSSDDPVSDPLDDEPVALIWTTCPDDNGLECATLSVPGNYNDPLAGEIDIALNRLPAQQQPAQALLFNPGGPGGSGKELVEVLADFELVPESVLQRYDLIGFDPRGIGESTPVGCDVFAIDLLSAYLANEDMISEYVTASADFAEDCLSLEGDYLLQLGSMNVVRDMESIRQALAVEKLNFIGYSYGTRLAALYLQTYPDSSGAFILDASVSPDSSVDMLVEVGLPVRQQNLENMLAQCTRTAPNCNPEELQQLLIDRVETLIAENQLDEVVLLGQLVLRASQSPQLADLLIAPLTAYLQNGDTSGLLVIDQLLNSDEGDAEEDERNYNNFVTAQKAVLCADDAARPTAEDLNSYLVDFNTESDLFAEAFVGFAGSCTGWPEAPEPLPIIGTSTAPVSLVIGGTTDAQTPIGLSEEMAQAIGGYYLASSHEGHTTVYSDDSACVDAIVTEFLIDGVLPTAGDCL